MTTAEKMQYKKLETEVKQLRNFVMGFLPTESLSDYSEPTKLKNSLTQALKEYKTGKYSTNL